MAEFQVTASTLKQKAEELSTLNNNFAKKVEELMASEKSLSGMWEGQAKEAFENAFNTDAGKMNQFKAAVDEYYSRLLTIVSQYEQAAEIAGVSDDYELVQNTAKEYAEKLNAE